MKRVLVPLAPGFEEVEALTVVDILRRSEVKVITAGIIDGPIEGRSGIRVIADVSLDEVSAENFDMIVLPGGMPGTTHLKEDPRVRGIVESLHEQGGVAAAICAAPLVLSAVGLLEGKRATSYPSVRDNLKVGEYSEERVVVDGNIVTSRGAGTAMEFSLKLLELLEGEEKMREISESVLAR